MKNLEQKKIDEINPVPSLEEFQTARAIAAIERADRSLLNAMETLAKTEKFDFFRQLETRCSLIEGRDARPVVEAKLDNADFRSSLEGVEIDGQALENMGNFSEAELSKLKTSIFSTTDVKLNHGSPVTFGRSCYQKCMDNDVKSGDCRFG